jgi:hypothetical protein
MKLSPTFFICSHYLQEIYTEIFYQDWESVEVEFVSRQTVEKELGAVVLEGAVVQHFGDRIETLNGRRNKKLLDLKVNNNLLYTTDLVIY